MLDFLLLFKVFLLSFLESITEFIPVSSTAHLILLDSFLKTNLLCDNFFLVIIQLGALFALIFYYKKDIYQILNDTFQCKKEGYIVVFNLFNAFLVTAIFGFVIKGLLSYFSFNNLNLIFYNSIIFGVIMILIHKKNGIVDELYKITPMNAFIIGLSQAFSVIPGVSRLGITMIFGILLNLKKENNIKFSFLLGIPTMLSASFYELVKLFLRKEDAILNLNIIYIFAFFSSFIISFLIINLMMKILLKINIRYFGYYRMIFAIFIFFLIKKL